MIDIRCYRYEKYRKPTAFLHGSPAYFVENLLLLTILFLKDSRVAKRRKRAVERLHHA
jgi:hypothetical protein